MIVYLHGFNSGAASGKAAWLKQNLPDITVLSPTYPTHKADEAPKFLRDYFARVRAEHPNDKKFLLVGSSLGGFWARYLAPDLGAGMALINPAMHPETDLMDAIGPNKNEATGEEYVLTAEQVRALARYQVPRCNPKVPTLVLLDEGDDVLNYRVAQSYYRGCGQVIVYPGGSHRFDHMAEALPEILVLYEKL
ncbi:MAG: alpha/beta fold hydrolase [Gammaproteobacteria bacterium]|nr:alpha/beta fold hydrolase [Gammaproteobacteria bacterium]